MLLENQYPITTPVKDSTAATNKLNKSLQDVVDVIVATPGLLIKLVEDDQIILSDLKTIIIDELDRLLDLGFEPDIESILRYSDYKKKQILMFGATLPKKTEKIAKKLVPNEIVISIGRYEIPKSISHEVHEVLPERRFEALVKILQRKDFFYLISYLIHTFLELI